MVAGYFMFIVDFPLFIWCYSKSEHCTNLPLFQTFRSKQAGVNWKAYNVPTKTQS